MLFFELHLIGEVDLNALNRLVEDYALNFKSRNKKNLKNLTSKNEENDYNSLHHLVKDVVDNSNHTYSNPINDVKKKISKTGNIQLEDVYSDKINLDLLKYYLILRFLKIRDIKFWIINILNYFRFIQKKFVIDMYRIENKNWKKAEHYNNLIYAVNEFPYQIELNNDSNKSENHNINNIPENSLINKDAFNIINSSNPLIPSYDILMNSLLENSNSKQPKENNEFQNKQNDNMSETPDIKQNHSINNLEEQNNQVSNNKGKENSTEYYKNFNKILLEEMDESVEFTEDNLVRIKDSRGNYIMFDATIKDMEQLENELGKIGTYYINKREELMVDTEKHSNPIIDRSQTILDLFTKEYEFLQAKFDLVNQLLACYDNITDIILQKNLMQTITDLIAQRPLLDLNFYYFNENYLLETEILRKKTAFIMKLIYHQIKIEVGEIKLIHEKNDKLYWLLGECALDFIKHISLDKLDVHLLKEFIKEKKFEDNNLQSKDKLTELDQVETFIDIFEKIILEKNFTTENNIEDINQKEINEIKDENILNIKQEKIYSRYSSTPQKMNIRINDKKNLEISKESYTEKEEEMFVDNQGDLISSSEFSTKNQENINNKSTDTLNKINEETVQPTDKKNLNLIKNYNEYSEKIKKKIDQSKSFKRSITSVNNITEKESFSMENQKNIIREEAQKKVEQIDLFQEMESIQINQLDKKIDCKVLEEIKEKNLIENRDKKIKDSDIDIENLLVIKENHSNKKMEKIYCEINIILKFLRKLFSQSIASNSENPEQNINIFNLNNFYKNSNNEIISKEDLKKLSDLNLIDDYEPIKKFLLQNNIPITENVIQSRRFYNKHSKNSQNMNINFNNNIEVLNFQVRSLLNIPNHFKDHEDKNLVEKNPTILNSLKDEMNFYRFHEGFPMKILNEYNSEDFLNIGNKNIQNTFLKNYDFFESLNILVPTLNFMSEGFSEIKKNFKSENFLCVQSMELCVLESYNNNWEIYKENITGKNKNPEFESLLFLNNSLLNNSENMMYLVRSLLATLSNSINRIPPQLIAKLPISILEKIEIDLIEFKDPNDNINVVNLDNIENIKLEELNNKLINIVNILNYKKICLFILILI